MRILFVTIPAQGHVRPLLGLALAARRRGHAVAWASGPDAAALVQAHGIEARIVGGPFGEALAAFRALRPDVDRLPGRDRARIAFPDLFARIVARPVIEPLAALVASWRPDLVVHEPAALAAPLAARRHGVRHLAHAFGLPVPAPLLGLAAEVLEPDWRAAGLEVPPDAGVYGGGVVEIAPRSLRAAGPAASPAPRVFEQRPASVTGSPADVPAGALDALARAAAGRALVAVTFGTLHAGGPVWSALLRALAEVPAQFVVTTGPVVAPLREDERPANVRMAHYLPFEQLLPRCTALVSHGGAGSALAALALGLPQLCLPHGADQFRNADALAACGVAHVLDAGDAAAPPSAGAIGAAIHGMLGDAAIRRAAERLRDEIRACLTPEQTIEQIEAGVASG